MRQWLIKFVLERQAARHGCRPVGTNLAPSIGAHPGDMAWEKNLEQPDTIAMNVIAKLAIFDQNSFCD
jgi:hypothetical protein